MATMPEEYVATQAANRWITATQLEKIYKDALDAALARFIEQQDT